MATFITPRAHELRTEVVMRHFQGKQALVTGVASGIGKQISLQLAQRGCTLWLWDVNAVGLEQTADEARALGVDVRTRVVDLSRAEDTDEALDELVSEWNGVDVLINNAGVCYYGPTENMSSEQMDWLMHINLLAPIRITHRLAPLMKKRYDTHILNVCSISGVVTSGRMSGYHTSKFGLIGFTEAIRSEYGRQGIGVTALCPGAVRTRLYSDGVSGRGNKAPGIPGPPKLISTTDERVARIAMKAIRRNRRQVVITPLAHVLFQFKRFAPWFLDFLNQMGRRKRMKRQRLAIEQAHLQPAEIPTRKAA